MPDKVIYEYAIIRIVPQVERAEFLNIGVILYAKKKKFLELKYHLDEKRLTVFSNKIDIIWLEKYLEAWTLICKGGKAAGNIGHLDLPSRFRWLTASKSTIIQCSKTHPGLCDNPQKMLEAIFRRYVL